MADDYYDEDKPKRGAKKLPSKTVKITRKQPKKTEVREVVVKNAKVPGRSPVKKK